MKRVLSVLLVLVMAFGLMGTVFAAESEFVPSISVKPAPEIVEVEDGYIGEIIDSEGNVIALVPSHLVISAVSEAETSEYISEEDKALLLDVYTKLTSGEMVLPAEKLSDTLTPDELTVRDLFDLSWVCDEASPTHEEMIAPEGVKLRITFNLNLAADVELFCMTYKGEEWNPIVSVANNGDGTVTCVFEHLCPVAFIYAEDKDLPITGSQFDMEMIIWASVMFVSSTALVVVVATRRNKERA